MQWLDAVGGRGQHDGECGHAGSHRPRRPQWTAAQILRNNGLELVGAEMEPDWAVHDGQYDYGITAADRTNSLALPPTREELARYQAHGVEPPTRFHYRELAADLARKAAELMPDNNDETAHILNTAGRWPRDVKVADRFYKALVNRCGNTALGRAADRKRWLP